MFKSLLAALNTLVTWFKWLWERPTGPNLVQNPSFEDGNFGPGGEMQVAGSGVIANWRVGPSSEFQHAARWITSSEAADGTRYVDLTGGRPPGPNRELSLLIQTGLLSEFQPGRKYEVAVSLGVGPSNGPLGNLPGPITVAVRTLSTGNDAVFVSNPPAPTSGVKWERFSSRFTVPATYPPGDRSITIFGTKGNYLIGVDDVSVRRVTSLFEPFNLGRRKTVVEGG